jgi:hypothetical protein
MVSPREIAGMIDGALVAIDFDGTLANITPHPEDGRLIDGALDALRALAAAGATVAIVTGRTAASALEVGEFAHVPGLVIEGLYGVERWHNDEFNSLRYRPRSPTFKPSCRTSSDGLLTTQTYGSKTNGSRSLFTPEWPTTLP